MISQTRHDADNDTDWPAPDDTAALGIQAGTRHVILRGLKLAARLGVHPHEHHGPQQVRADITIIVRDAPHADVLADVLDYESIATGLRALADREHLQLIETLAEQAAALCLAAPETLGVRVRLEKLEAIDDCEGVGVEIMRWQREQ